MAASEIRLPKAHTSESDSDVVDYEDIDEDRLSQTSANSKSAPMHFVTSHNITYNATSNIACFSEQQFSTSTSANSTQSFTTDGNRQTQATQQNEQVSSSADVSSRASWTTKPSVSPGESYEDIDIGAGYENIDTRASAVSCSQTSRRMHGAATSLDDGGDYEDVDAIRFRHTNNEQNTGQQLSNKNVRHNMPNFTAHDNTNNCTADIWSNLSSYQSATSSVNANNITDQSESSSPDTNRIRFVQ